MGASSPSSLTGCAIIDGGMVIRWRSVNSGDVYLYSFTGISESTIIAENQNIIIYLGVQGLGLVKCQARP